MSESGSAPLDSAEIRSDLQDRLARFTRDTFFISGGMLLLSIGIDVSNGYGSLATLFVQAPRVAHVICTLALLAGWRTCRGNSASMRRLEAMDAMLTILLCVGWAMLGVGMAPANPIEFGIILAFTHTLIGRSVMVPSSYQRTLWISACSALPVLSVLIYRQMAFIPGASASLVRSFLLFSSIWCLVAVVVATLNSRQIFGLRRQIREIGKLGQYTLEDKIGEGGMGVVYRAAHAMLRRPAAIKLLLPERASERDLARFEREVQLTSQLYHPNTISIFDFGRTAGGTFYYVMEYLDGVDLERLVREAGPLEPARVIRILVQACGSLAEAHALGLIHRDIKPANIILTERADESDIVKVVDFGLVKTTVASSDPAVTHVNAITGTPLYLSPESITAPETVDGRADLYALGAVGYFLLTGKHVFDGASIVEVCSKHLLETPVPPSERAGRPMPDDLQNAILSCLAKAASDRPASAQSLRAQLLACADASRWDAEAARTWWRDEGTRIRAQKTIPPSREGSSTMVIDLRRRAARTEQIVPDTSERAGSGPPSASLRSRRSFARQP